MAQLWWRPSNFEETVLAAENQDKDRNWKTRKQAKVRRYRDEAEKYWAVEKEKAGKENINSLLQLTFTEVLYFVLMPHCLCVSEDNNKDNLNFQTKYLLNTMSLKWIFWRRRLWFSGCHFIQRFSWCLEETQENYKPGGKINNVRGAERQEWYEKGSLNSHQRHVLQLVASSVFFAAGTFTNYLPGE